MCELCIQSGVRFAMLGLERFERGLGLPAIDRGVAFSAKQFIAYKTVAAGEELRPVAVGAVGGAERRFMFGDAVIGPDDRVAHRGVTSCSTDKWSRRVSALRRTWRSSSCGRPPSSCCERGRRARTGSGR